MRTQNVTKTEKCTEKCTENTTEKGTENRNGNGDGNETGTAMEMGKKIERGTVTERKNYSIIEKKKF